MAWITTDGKFRLQAAGIRVVGDFAVLQSSRDSVNFRNICRAVGETPDAYPCMVFTEATNSGVQCTEYVYRPQVEEMYRALFSIPDDALIGYAEKPTGEQPDAIL